MAKIWLKELLILNLLSVLFSCGQSRREEEFKPASIVSDLVPNLKIIHERELNTLSWIISFSDNIDSDVAKELSNPPRFSWSLQLSNGERISLTTEKPGKFWSKKSQQLTLLSRGLISAQFGEPPMEFAVLGFLDSPGITVRSKFSSDLIEKIEWAWSLNSSNFSNSSPVPYQEKISIFFNQITGGKYAEYVVAEVLDNPKSSNKGNFLLAELKEFDLKNPIFIRGCHSRFFNFSTLSSFPSGARLRQESCGVFRPLFITSQSGKI